ncbi:sodium:proton antiporter [Falsiroseomonas selenitidurans]|uniref:Sodium:proton antiporter n=1 Tax=Falsiroseomonas selenitidurans TaxID=2716335 RepID=A0ABX1E311_9PROT|nr:sodium:proton antiporter [Falsiroseomonas selenitidurans]NKC31562.1 sodium:proton antiporter [Falsiroseomonas selenitidurans]
MRGMVLRPLAGAALLLPGPAFAAGVPGEQLSLAWGIPFVGILLSIALMPLVAAHLWHHHYGKIAALWAALFVLPFAVAFGPDAAWYELTHVMVLEYVPFIALLLALYTAGGGVLLKGSLVGTPTVNTALLAVGTILASMMGTTGAAMLLIRPVLRANAFRTRKTHTFVFFIFLVANIGGSLTPVGDPPLYLGFLRGVSFFWPTTHLFAEFLTCVVILLAIYWLLDTLAWNREKPVAPVAAKEPLGIEGWLNVWLVLAIVAVVIGMGYVKLEEVTILGQPMALERVLGIVLFLAITGVSVAFTSTALREANGFAWGAILEVAKLFAAIFICMAPVLAILRAGSAGDAAGLVALTSGPDGAPIPWVYFWLTGLLSSFLDNAPTYIVFFELAGGDPATLMGQGALTLAAISCGAVFMGANSYIGNAPNFMVKAIVEENGNRMPSFFAYCGWAVVFLVPLFVLVSLIFFRPA